MKERSIETLSLDGGRLCLDFVNTVHDRTEEDSFDYLAGYGDLLEWSVKVEILTSPERDDLEAAAGKNRKRAERALHDSIEVREILYDCFLAIAQNRVPDNDPLERLNRAIAETMRHLELRIEENLDVREQWKDTSDLRFPTNPVIKSAYELLTSGKLSRIKECGECGWLFFDRSKNRSRKWCSMETCGSIVKAKRYYHRNKDKEL